MLRFAEVPAATAGGGGGATGGNRLIFIFALLDGVDVVGVVVMVVDLFLWAGSGFCLFMILLSEVFVLSCGTLSAVVLVAVAVLAPCLDVAAASLGPPLPLPLPLRLTLTFSLSAVPHFVSFSFCAGVCVCVCVRAALYPLTLLPVFVPILRLPSNPNPNSNPEKLNRRLTRLLTLAALSFCASVNRRIAGSALNGADRCFSAAGHHSGGGASRSSDRGRAGIVCVLRSSAVVRSMEPAGVPDDSGSAHEDLRSDLLALE